MGVSPADSGQDQLVNPQTLTGKVPSSADHAQRNYRAHLNGRNVVPPVDTKAQGKATFQVSKDGMKISYKLIASNIENVLMAHIHLGATDENGPVVVWLYPKDGPSPKLIDGRFDGVLAEGTITADDLTGPLGGENLQNLINQFQDGNAYVQAHTQQNMPGEIRGQIR